VKLEDQGYAIVNLPPASERLLASFDDLPLDVYCGGTHRFHRFSQYRVRFDGDSWQLELLPHRPLIQSSAYNQLSGDMYRHFEPLQVDPSAYFDAVFKARRLDTTRDWHLDINQYRVQVEPGREIKTVPEGAHQDGHRYIIIMIFRRHRIRGAETLLLPLDGGPPLLRRTIEEDQAIVIADERMLHDATDIEATGAAGETGYRDFFGSALNSWEDRRYGPEFEARVLARSVAT
jgi:hypothetical protein